MATKRVCDICGKDAPHSLFVSDGGTQRDVASGRTEETGDNYDFCGECLLDSYRFAVSKTPEAQIYLACRITRTIGRRFWNGK